VTCDPLTKTERLCGLDEVPEAGAHEVVATVNGASESLILMRRGDAIAAFLNICPHAGRRLDWAPGRFLFDQGFLVCAAHGACFSVPDGRCVSGPCRGQSLTGVPILVRDTGVFLAPELRTPD
jgi:nitrite reductase/ring-hydroxylating ferredoxin subunit